MASRHEESPHTLTGMDAVQFAASHPGSALRVWSIWRRDSEEVALRDALQLAQEGAADRLFLEVADV